MENIVKITTDIDIDTPDRAKVLSLFRHVVAYNKKTDRAHVSGVYFHDVPTHPHTGLCSIDYKEAERLGFFKLDLLNVSIYNLVKDHVHLVKLLKKEPIWSLLEEKEFCDMVFHLRGHHAICEKMKPQSVLELAAVLALIRPAKRHLIGESWDKVFESIWSPSGNGEYAFKKSHAISYAMAVKVHMNVLIENAQNDC
jgi:DNA polymerase III alpha subunit